VMYDTACGERTQICEKKHCWLADSKPLTTLMMW
jgi:hypothetical protein